VRHYDGLRVRCCCDGKWLCRQPQRARIISRILAGTMTLIAHGRRILSTIELPVGRHVQPVQTCLATDRDEESFDICLRAGVLSHNDIGCECANDYGISYQRTASILGVSNIDSLAAAWNGDSITRSTLSERAARLICECAIAVYTPVAMLRSVGGA
jgi:hypothetical protein